MRKSYTKMAIAEALKNLCKVKKLENITVQDITRVCEVNRGTFYYHFCDIQELICWVFYTDVIAPVREIINGPIEEWIEISPYYMNAIYKNKDFYIQALVINEQNDLKSYMLKETRENLLMCTERVIDEYLKSEKVSFVDYDMINFIVNYHAKGAIALIEDWAKEGMVMDPKELADFFDLMFNTCIGKGLELALK